MIIIITVLVVVMFIFFVYSMYMFFVWYWMCHRIVYCISVHMIEQLLSVCLISLFQILQSYHHITERRKYVHEYERQKTFLEFFSKYIWWLSKGKFRLARSNKNHVESSEKKKNIKFSSKHFQQFSASFDFPWVSEFSTFRLSQIFNYWFPSVSASLYYFYQSPKHYNSSHWWSVQTRIVIVRCSSVFSLVYTPNSATLTLNYRLFIHVQVWWG